MNFYSFIRTRHFLQSRIFLFFKQEFLRMWELIHSFIFVLVEGTALFNFKTTIQI
ncbi:hypothetical protein LEP1GSC073_1854 [Leptospira noguchii str. Cascata]|nr:hypothetical protein LEP1GSC073_1854 [Leptospira noguchii str. Cascata]